MPYHSRPISETEIDSLPLRFVKLEQGEQETFIDVLLQVWCALAQSGSLATLPPVPDIVSFVDDCTFFYLIFHTSPSELKFAPKDHLTSTPPPKVASSSKSPRSSPNKRPHPYAHARPPNRASPLTEDRSSSEDALPTSDEIIGCVYLSHSPSTQSALDIGIALRPEARGRGFGRATITKFIRFAFDALGVHRIVANVFGPSDINQQLSARESGSVRWIFEKIGFVPEGVQRRAAFSAAEGIWRDVYPLSMLDVDWVRLCGRQPEGRAGISSPFDAMLERHNTEREEMSEWMDDPSWGRLRRVLSTETIKGQDNQEPAPKTEARTPSPVHSEFSFTVPSEHDWRSVTPSTDLDYSVVSHSPPPDSIVSSPPGSDAFNFSLSDVFSSRINPATPNSEPTFSMIGSPDLEPPLSPGFSTTDDDIIELAPLSGLPPAPPSPSPAPHSEPILIPQRRSVFRFADGDEPLDFWQSDSDFDGSERGR
ncbi:hypothetical protein B0J17DRAFT_641103 [Rhizoctonia solani]|nr:hypothetical protein B0J17DRAFT_641103 [Rhizoctonia solani]